MENGWIMADGLMDEHMDGRINGWDGCVGWMDRCTTRELVLHGVTERIVV